MREMQTDLLVIGSGGGLIAALRAKECGVKDVIVLEKQKRVGGVCVMACGVSAVGTERQKARGDKQQHDEARLFTEMMEKSGWAADPYVVRAFVANSGTFMEWVESKGIHPDIVEERDRCFLLKTPHKKRTGKETSDLGNAIIDEVYAQALEQGVQVLLETPATSLLQDESGKVIGAMAKEKDGTEVKITAKAVILSAGGFCDNKEMRKKLCGRFFDPEKPWEFMPFESDIYMGEGIQMALAAGSRPDPHVDIVVGGPTHHGPMSVSEAALSPLVIVVNKLGRRYMAEVLGNDGYFAAANQPDAESYAIFDDAAIEPLVEELRLNKRYVPNEKEIPKMVTLREDLEKTLAAGGTEFHGTFKTKALCRAETIEELAEFIGCDAARLKKTIEDYNHYVETGVDEEMFKDPQWLKLPIKTAPFYAMKMMRFNQCTHGGISIDEKMQVIKDDWRNPIPGLYATGDSASGWCSELGWLGMTSLTWALNSGYMAGENAAEYIAAL
jgi:fumarate reductase flavoprotein subunit